MTTDRDPEQERRLIDEVAAGDRTALERLVPLVYDQLHGAARNLLGRERVEHTLSATALVNEAFVKLAGPREVPWAGRAHFYSAAAEAMRRILVDHARARAAHRRGGPDARRMALDLSELPDLDSEEESAGFLILHEAILRLEEVDEEAARVVRLRYFAGLSVAETARTLGCSEPTVKRSWAFARGWLRDTIESGRV